MAAPERSHDQLGTAQEAQSRRRRDSDADAHNATERRRPTPLGGHAEDRLGASGLDLGEELGRQSPEDRRRHGGEPEPTQPEAGWADSRSQGGYWNSAERPAGGCRRFPIEGLEFGYGGEKAVTSGASSEGVVRRAVAIVPAGVCWSEPLDVLLHLHGHSAGSRERARGAAAVGRKGTVRDVELEKIPQQLAASGRNMVAILPQGDEKSKFGANTPARWDALVREVLQRLAALLPELEQAPQVARLVLSAHSGGGHDIGLAAAGKRLPSQTRQIILFEAINGRVELDKFEKWAGATITSAVARVRAAAEQGTPAEELADLLRASTVRLVAHAHNKEGYGAHGSRNAELRRSVKKALRSQRATLSRLDPSGELFAALESCFEFEFSVAGDHDSMMGDGSKPAENKQPTTEAPSYEPGSGALEKALGGVSGDR